MARPNSVEIEKAFSPMRDAVLLWLLLMGTSLVSLLFVGFQAVRVLDNEVRTIAEKTADSVAILLDKNAHAQFVANGRMWSTEHKALIEPLLDYHRRFPATGRLRTLAQQGGQFAVILDTETFAGELGMNRPVDPQAFRSPMNENDSDTDLAHLALQNNDTLTEENSDAGPFGDFLTAAAPFGSGGVVLATVDVTEGRTAQRRIMDVVFIGSGISLIVVTIVAVGFFNLRSSFVMVATSENEALRGQAWQQERNQHVVEAMGQLVLHRDLQRECILWSGDSDGSLGVAIDRMPVDPRIWESKIHPEDLKNVQDSLARALNGAKVFEIEFRVKSESGDWVWFSERGVASFDSRSGKAIAVDSVLLDITEKKRAAARLAALALIASRTDNAVCLTLPDGSIEWVNDAFERVTGYTRDEAMYKKLYDIVSGAGEALSAVRTMVDNAAVRLSQFAEIELQNKSNETYWAHLEVQPLADETGTVTKLVAIQSDRTASKEFEARLVKAKDAAETADRAKSEFLAVMSHEVRTPLNAVIGFTSLLLDSPLNDQQRDYLRTIHASGENLLSLVNDILDFSRMEADKFILEKTHFDLRQAIENTLDILGVAAAKKGLELICDLGSETPPIIYGDQNRLKQVILNLAGNAVKFTEVGDVIISVRVVGKQGDFMRLRFEVRDTGPGIEFDRQQELFKPFSQADSTATRRYGGTGLGLAISKRLVKLMGGEVGMESSPGNGSTFWFELPTEVNADRELDFATVMPLRGQSVILVENNTALRAVITNQLTRWGMQIKSFSRGRDAVFAAEQRRFDVAIIDTNMRDIDAVRLVERMRRVPRGGVDRIIFLEMPGQSALEPHLLPAMVQVLRKPIRISNLLQLLLQSTAAIAVLEPTLPEEGVPSLQEEVPQAVSAPDDSSAILIPRILVADDNAVNRKLVAKMLAKMGYESAMASNGLEALNAVETSQFDVILMDLQMPEMDGLEATRQIRQRGLEIPIIAITADAMPDDQIRCAAAGMNDYLSKPVRAAALEASLKQVLGKVSA